MRHLANRSLADVLPSCAAALGVPGFGDSLDVGECDVAVVLLVDGLGATSIEDYPDLFTVFGNGSGGSIEAAFPTTTATGLASLGTGMRSGRHGIVGASFFLPETGSMLSPLHWGSDPSPLVVQPERTIFEQVAAAGFDCTAVGPASYAGSGLTKAVLRGTNYVHAEDLDERIAAVQQVVASGSGLVYVYWPALDRAGHEFGVGTMEWQRAARDVNELIERLVGALGPLGERGRLLVTADHGMVDAGERIWVEDTAHLAWGVHRLGGEPRVRHVYCDAESLGDVHRRWSDVLTERVRIWTREAAIAEGLFGPVEEGLAERIGDLVVVCQPGVCLASRVSDPRLSMLPGQHGGLSDEERRIPGVSFSG